tara:strand:+ start:287 stop:580 length:294 start_codon:yes stop_codon:yes gene_type:complete
MQKRKDLMTPFLLLKIMKNRERNMALLLWKKIINNNNLNFKIFVELTKYDNTKKKNVVNDAQLGLPKVKESLGRIVISPSFGHAVIKVKNPLIILPK